MESLIKMNDWGIKRFMIVILSVQIGMWGIIGLDSIGLQIPILRQLVGFIYLTFVPGIVILRILRIHKTSAIETVSYSIGLSIALLMFTGFLINEIYPIVGISKPISLFPLMVTITIIILILLILSYYRDNNISVQNSVSARKLPTSSLLCLVMLPILSVLGTYQFNSYGNNTLLLSLFVIICLTVVLFTFIKVPTKLYGLAVFVIAIAILFHRALISMYLTGWDINLEYYFSNMVVINSHYNPSNAFTLNAMLSIVMLNPIYSVILNMDGVWVFKIIYPILFSIVPLMLYHIYRTMMNNKTAFFSVFLFMSFYAFFTEMVGLARQQIAMLFFILLIGLMIDKKIEYLSKIILSIIFAASLIVSHYTISYFYIFYSITALLVSIVKRQKGLISGSFISIFIVLSLAWYIFISQGAVFESATHFVDQVYNGIYTKLLNPSTRDPAVAYTFGQLPTLSIQRHIFAILQYTIQFFIVIGAIMLLFKHKKMEMKKDFIPMVYASFLILLMCIILPYLSTLNMSRVFLFVLIFLSPVCIQGGMIFINTVAKLFNPKLLFHSNLKIIVLIILIPYFLFNTGFIYEVTHDPPSSISLSKDMDYIRFSQQEVYSAKWLYNANVSDFPVYSDAYGSPFLKGIMGLNKIKAISTEEDLQNPIYIYLRSFNIKNGKILSVERTRGGLITKRYFDMSDEEHPISVRILRGDKIYENSESYIVFSKMI